MVTPSQEPLRSYLLHEVKRFVQSASQVPGVRRIALVGSLATDKLQPKDADVLVTIAQSIEMDSLARAGRRLKGKGQSRGSGADIFLCRSNGDYVGRLCSYRDCHPRMACMGTQCHLGTRICDDFDQVLLKQELIRDPPLELWPKVVRRHSIPVDVENALIG